MINNHVLPRMVCSCAILAVALAHCGCQSLKGPSGWPTAWASKPPAAKNPNDRETVTYLGFGQKKKPAQPDVGDLKSRMETAAKDSRQNSFDNYLRQGNQSLRENRLDDAKKDYEKALALRPEHPDCHHRLAVIADKQGQFGLADDHYEAALKARPRDPNLLSDIGYSYSLRGDDRRAEATLKEALAVSASHTGAMFNLGSIYAKQGRYEETLAMFRRGVPEAQAQQSVAKLFPQHPAGSNPSDIVQAQNTTSNPNPKVDLLGMDQDQLKAEMNRRKWESIERRKQQQMAELPPRREWLNDDPQQQRSSQQNQYAQPNEMGRSNAPIVLGPGSGNQQYANSQQNPQAAPNNDLPMVTPNSGMNSQGYANNGSNQQGFGQNASNGFGQAGPNGYTNNGASVDPAGTRPNSDVWDGAPNRDVRSPYGAGQHLVDNMGGNGAISSPNVPPSSIHYGPARRIPGVSGLQPSIGSGQGDQAGNLAAAQLGMNVGPGGLFPVVHTDDNGQSGFGDQGVQNAAPIESKFGAEFSSPPQYQNPASQPRRSAFSGGDQRQGSLQSPWGTSASPSRAPSRFADISEGEPLAPPSPTSDWQQNRVAPTGGAFATNSSNMRFGNDPVERLPSGPTSAWTEKPNLNNAAPFSGSWPTNSQSSGNTSTGNTAPIQNSIPMWNGGAQGNSNQPRMNAPAGGGQPASYPEQWQYSPQR